MKLPGKIALIICLFISIKVNGQLQKATVLVGSDISQLNLNFQSHNTAFSFAIDPKAGVFIRDNKVVGAQLTFGLATQNGETTIQYGLSIFGRYYFGKDTVDMDKKCRWFIEASGGPYGTNISGKNVEHTSTNGLTLGFGPGFSYFLSRSVALEALAKYNLGFGFGNDITNSSVSANLGLQVFFPVRKFRMMDSRQP